MRTEIKGGWKSQIFDLAEKVIVKCQCGQEINLKVETQFGCIKTPHKEKEIVYFLCKNCFKKMTDFATQLIKKNEEEGE